MSCSRSEKKKIFLMYQSVVCICVGIFPAASVALVLTDTITFSAEETVEHKSKFVEWLGVKLASSLVLFCQDKRKYPRIRSIPKTEA